MPSLIVFPKISIVLARPQRSPSSTVLVSDPGLQNQFTQVHEHEERESEKLAIGDLASKMSRLKLVGENLSEEERAASIQDLYKNVDEEVDCESFLKVYLKLQTLASSRIVGSPKNSSAFLKVATTTLLHKISESEKASYVIHINNYLAEDEFLKRHCNIPNFGI